MGFKLEKLVENKLKQKSCEEQEEEAKQVVLVISHGDHSL